MRAFLRKSGILVWVIAAIILATILGSIRIGGDHLVPVEIGRIFATFSAIFSQFLSFSIPLIIIGLVTPAIADLGRGAGKWLGITTAIAYGSTLFSGFLTFLVCASLFPRLLASTQLGSVSEPGSALESYFTIEMPAPLQVMTALLLSFVVGLGLSMVPRGVLRKGFIEFRAIITRLIETIIIPLLPLHIFGIFLNLTYTGEAASVIRTLLRVVVVVLVLEVVILLTQFCFAGAVARRNPIKSLLTMMPAYLTALGTSSSAATIPVTLAGTRRNGVSEGISAFVIPLCATIHLSGSMLKIVSCALALILVSGGAYDLGLFTQFILLLGITMVAAPGVPGGAIMAALAVLASVLGFTAEQQALMISLYITMDSFGTACNVTGDGAIALAVDKIAARASKLAK